ncbi:guanylate-binding protein 2-like [Mya arenaria]|uniref:guanylate-binding protein 2-like n=1 Tax=Mya arenaria TaxID=6604 RepID=UPI0022E55AED|nr:guanylate-binding protein 2-like [Mya arenaria]
MANNLSSPGDGIEETSILTEKAKRNMLFSKDSSDEEYEHASDNSSVKRPHALHQFDDLRVFYDPISLIYSEKDQTFRFHESVVAELEKIDLPMVIVGIAGLYRTGKSYLLNLIAGAKRGFQTGHSIEPATKGINVWCMMHPKQKDTVLVLLDTEGFGDVEKDDYGCYDLKIFTLVTLLSNVLIYNMNGIFDRYTLTQLELVSEMAKKIKFNGKCNDGNLHIVMPSFALVMRNFSLTIKGKNGTQITADEHLESTLEYSKEKREEYNKTRESVKRCFQKRKCFCLAPPGDVKLIQQLASISFSETCQHFQTSVDPLLEFVFKEEPKRLLTSKPIKGPVFANLVRDFVTSISKEGVSDVDATFTRVTEEENKQIGIAASKIFQRHIKDLMLPIKRRELHQHYTIARDAALKHVFENAILDGLNGNVAFNVAKKEIEEFWKGTEDKNENLLQEKCTQALEECRFYWELKESVESKNFREQVGIHEYQKKICRYIEDEYNEKLASFEEHERLPVWQKFAKHIFITESEILAMEQARQQSKALYENDRFQIEHRSERKASARREEILQHQLSQIAIKMSVLRCELDDMRKKVRNAIEKNEKICRLM